MDARSWWTAAALAAFAAVVMVTGPFDIVPPPAGDTVACISPATGSARN